MARHRPRECPVCREDVPLGQGVWVKVKGRERMAHPECWSRAKADRKEAAR